MSKLNILIAYPYFQDKYAQELRKIKDEIPHRLIIDSGAFTAWNTGRVIHLDDYCRFLDSIEHLRPFHAVQLDVFGDAEKTYKNFMTMKSRGYDVMPVFTRGDSLARLEEFYSHTDYIMFGGIVIGGENKNYVKWFLDQNKGRKCHWLGFVNLDFIKHYRPESVDSSSFSSGARFGTQHFYLGHGQMKSIKRLDFVNKPSEEIYKAAARIGLNASDLAVLGQQEAWKGNGRLPTDDNSNSTAAYYNVMSHLVRNDEIERNLGTKVYFAVSGYWLLYILSAARQLMKKGILKYDRH